ncbi:LiaI-LiaF-like domain-containing protein [Persicitalea sp.]|uniref:LiaI-LiaF-like domain-containing protein n=1 Tax=Persicitalea sp. TaxID=3100273 RepID=UPI0035939D11
MNFKNTFWGILLIVVGVLFLVEEFSNFDFGRYFLPIILIVSGGLLLLRHQLGAGNSTDSSL